MNNDRNRIKTLLLTASLAALLMISIGGTFAYLVHKSAAVTNDFEAGEAPDLIIEETFDGDTKEDVFIRLDGGDGKYYVRAAIVYNLLDEENAVVPKTPVSGTDYSVTMGSDWTQGSDGFWYYKEAIGGNDSTSDLIESCIALSGDYRLTVDVLAQCIQAYPSNAVEDAWNYTPVSGD